MTIHHKRHTDIVKQFGKKTISYRSNESQTPMILISTLLIKTPIHVDKENQFNPHLKDPVRNLHIN